ncbi:MAG: nickel pincer cofactor biosynthesis protein LarB [Candidatus Methanomethylophilaceae archaeon]|nr:nickel pincer cofactor biosynthesis protein LarB [Candidatus Methanomethylophilaceae archaeon]
MTGREILEAVRDGRMSVEDAERMLRSRPFVDLGFAKVDTQRRSRQGASEVIYGASKTPEQSVKIAETLLENGSECVMVTRCTKDTYDLAASKGLKAEYRPEARICILGEIPEKKRSSYICVVCAGTSDIPVAEEAAITAEVLGCNVKRSYDAGVAGIHRLLSDADTIMGATAVVVAAGMEGALPSVVGGLVSVPVIAVPTSVGYGASFEGLTALLAMMNSCASTVSVVNIDNGFGAGYIASLIDKRGEIQ